VERLRVPLAGEGDDLVDGEGREGSEFDDLANGKVFEVEDRGLLWVRAGGRE
jgi:hypothetical protein